MCECSGDASTCHTPGRFRIHQEPFNNHFGLSKEELVSFLGNPEDVQMLKVERTSFADIDGRNPTPSLCTPGGDFGEFLFALGVFEGMAGQNFTEATIRGFVSNWLSSRLLPVYYATDEDSIANIERHLHINGQTGVVVGLDLVNPRQDYIEPLLQDIVKPQNQGSRVLKAVLANPQRFYMRSELVANAIRAFFRVLWDKQTLGSDGVLLSSKINLVVLQGKNNERAWINARGGKHCESEHKAPAFAPQRGDVQVFLNHPEAARAFRKHLVRLFLSQSVTLTESLSEAEMLLRVDRAAGRNMEALAELLASQSPFYTVTGE
jgi:hypothetical protein